MSIERRCDTCVHWKNAILDRPPVTAGHGLCAASGDVSTMSSSMDSLRMQGATATAYMKGRGNDRAYFETAPWHNCLTWTRKPRPPKKTT